MIATIIILSVVVVVLGFTTINLLLKNEKYEDIDKEQQKILLAYQGYISKISSTIEVADKLVQKLDAKGSFKSDDEIGFFFNSIKDIQSTLNEFQVKEIKEVK